MAALSYGDAVSHDALALQGHLRAAGLDSEIYAEHAHPRMARHCRRLWEYARVSSPDTVCLFHFAIGSGAGRFAFQSKDRLVTRYHNITPPEYFAQFLPHLARQCHQGRRELRAFAGRSLLGLGVSEFNRRELEAAGYRRTGVVPISLDLEAFAAGPASAVIQRVFGDGRTNVLFVGRIIPNKRIDDLIRVFAAYQRYVDPVSRLLLVGDHRGHERYYDRLQELVRELRLDEVVFTGHVDDADLEAYYSVADAFLCLSEHEGYCVPLLEAMLRGVPVLAYDAGAVKETLRGGGILLKRKRPEEVAELLHDVVARPALRAAVLATQERAVAALRATDFGALLRARLAPVLER